MALSGSGRTLAIYTALTANGVGDKLTGTLNADGTPSAAFVSRPDSTMGPSEKFIMYQSLAALYATDTDYLTGNATILPGTMTAPAGASVQVTVPGGAGSTTSPSPVLSGVGRLT